VVGVEEVTEKVAVPSAPVVALEGVTLPVPEYVSATGAPEMTLPPASRTVTVTEARVAPSAATLPARSVTRELEGLAGGSFEPGLDDEQETARTAAAESASRRMHPPVENG
jgi:hypothetical protein